MNLWNRVEISRSYPSRAAFEQLVRALRVWLNEPSAASCPLFVCYYLMSENRRRACFHYRSTLFLNFFKFSGTCAGKGNAESAGITADLPYNNSNGVNLVEDCLDVLMASVAIGTFWSQSVSSKLAYIFNTQVRLWFIRCTSPFVWGWPAVANMLHIPKGYRDFSTASEMKAGPWLLMIR